MMFLTLLLSAATSFAYIPEFSLITSRAADQHGRGAFRIEQEVVYRREAEVFSVKEIWTVVNEGAMTLTLEGRGPLKGLVQGTIIYNSTNKFFIEDSKVRSQRLGDDWLEPFFHFRSSKYFNARLVALKVVPTEALRDRTPMKSDSAPNYTAPSFIRLSRTGGAVCWAIGINPKVGIAPTLWLEQDQFILRKFRSANQTVLKADLYQRHSGTVSNEFFWYPRQQTYSFGQYNVQINTLSVKSLGRLKSSDKRFKSASLVAAKDALKRPEADGLREFYARFR